MVYTHVFRVIIVFLFLLAVPNAIVYQPQTLLTPSFSSATSMTAVEPLPLQSIARVYIDHILLYTLLVSER